MRNCDQRRSRRKESLERLRDPSVSCVVNIASGFVHDDDSGALQQSSCQDQKLPLAQREIGAPVQNKAFSQRTGNDCLRRRQSRTPLRQSYSDSKMGLSISLLRSRRLE
jgi:hypothetical protein